MRVAALEEPSTAAAEQLPEAQQAPLITASAPTYIPPAEDQALLELQELELSQLDAEQEQLLSWMIHTDEETQDADLDEMEDYEELGDEEYEELVDEVEKALDAADTDLKVGDKVMGTVFEVRACGASGLPAACCCCTGRHLLPSHAGCCARWTTMGPMLRLERRHQASCHCQNAPWPSSSR